MFEPCIPIKLSMYLSNELCWLPEAAALGKLSSSLSFSQHQNEKKCRIIAARYELNLLKMIIAIDVEQV